MAQFLQFDISDFLNEIKEPVMLLDEDEIVFFNKYFQENFPPMSDDWKRFFDHPSVIQELKKFFSSGVSPQNRIDKSHLLNSGEKVKYDWGFIKLPSSYNSRFLVAKGTLVRQEHVVPDEELLHSGGASPQSYDFVRSILNNSHDLITILDREGNYKFVSDSVGERLGYATEEILGLNYSGLVEKGIIEPVVGDFSKILETTEEIGIDFWVKKASGERVYLECFAKNMLNHPLIQGVICSSRDITEYIHTSTSLKKRYEIENLVIQISSRLINGKSQEIESEFFIALSRFGDFLQATKAEILVFNGDADHIEVLTAWTASGEVTSKFLDAKEELHLIFENQHFLKKGKVRLLSPEGSEQHHRRDPGFLRILIPMISKNKLLGLIRFESEAPGFLFEEKEIQVLRQLGDVLAGVYLSGLMTQKLERSESLLAHAEAVSKSGSWKFNIQKHVFNFSAGLAKLFDLETNTINDRFSLLIHKIDKPFKAEFVKNLRISGEKLIRTSGEFTTTDRTGAVRFIGYEIEGKREFLTNALEVYGLCTDISHKRASETYLRLQSQILAQVSDPILVTNLEFDVIYQNEAAVQMCCLERSRDFEGSLGDLLTVEWEKEESFEKISSNLKLGEVWESERYVQAGNSESLPYDISIQAIHAEGREKIGYSIILRGLQEKYKSEQIAKSAQLIVENSPAVLFRVDPNENFRIHYISENIHRFGYEAANLIENRVSFLDLLHPSDVEMILTKTSKDRVAGGVPAFSGEYRVKTSSGEYVWVEDRTRDVTTDTGKIILHEGLFQDISDRKSLEEMQSERDMQYRVLAANIPDTNIFLINSDRKYILAEGTNFEKWDLTREDFEGKTLKDLRLTPYEQLSEIIDRVYNQQETVETVFEIKGRRYHRSIRPIIIQDEVKYALSIVRDVHDEYQAKQDLEQSEEKYRRLVEESTEVIFSLTETFLLHYVSPNVKQFLGYESTDVIGRSIFEFLHPDDLNVFLILLGESEDFLAQHQYLEYRLKHINGDYRVFNSNGKLIEAKNGIHRYYTGVARDISRLKETQRELVLAKEKAEQASQVKSQFLSVMSHEIRTPMNAVIGLAHFLMEENPRPDQLENLKTLQFSAQSLMALINDILDYTKIDSGKIDLEHEPFELRHIIHRIVHAHSFPASEKSLRISCEIDESIPQTFLGDSLRIGQIINNLMSNAIKFTETGFVRISVIREFTQGNKADIRFVFEDSGIGIPESKKKLIFEAFTQASSSTSRKYGGTGLGLAIVKRLVELFGGDIEVRDRRGGGSVFEFTLPMEFVDLQKVEAEKAQQINRKSLEQASILVAEDNAVNQILIRKFLLKWNVGHLVIASDGQEALDQFDAGNFNLVLLDLQMPVMDGFSVARAIRNYPDEVKKRVPILALTAASINEVREEMNLNGMNDFIPKPFTPELLFDKILKYLKPKDHD
jgi:PAS domain S-box-containing protein